MKTYIYTAIIIAALTSLLYSHYAQASYTKIDDNNFLLDDGNGNFSNLFLSPLDNSCLLPFTPTCTVLDVGFVTWETSQSIENLVTGERMLQLFAEGIFNETVVPGGNYWIVDESGNPSLIFKPQFNADFGTVGTGLGAFFWATETVSAVPVPAAVWLFTSGLLGLVAVGRRK